MGENRGRFVVLEGIDGSGTTTHVARLAERLRALRVPVRATREPSDGPAGTLIRHVLAGRVVVPGGRAPGWATMALLFAADRMVLRGRKSRIASSVNGVKPNRS